MRLISIFYCYCEKLYTDVAFYIAVNNSGLNMFSDKHDEAVVRFVQFSKEPNEDICLEIRENKINVSDDDLRQIIRQEFGIDAIKICNEMKEKQDEILQVMNAIDGTTIRQIARITGLSSTRVWKA